MIDVNKVIITSTEVSNKVIYGLIYQVEGIGTTNIPIVPETFIDVKAKTITQRLSSRPLPVPTNIDAVITVTVCTGSDDVFNTVGDESIIDVEIVEATADNKSKNPNKPSTK